MESEREIPGRHQDVAFGFLARYVAANGESVVVQLGQPAEIVDADRQVVQAYPLEIYKPVDGAKADDVVFWLAGDFRLVRHDHICIRAPCPDYHAMSWRLRGAIAPFGIGLNNLVANGEATQSIWGFSEVVQVDKTVSGNQTRIQQHGTELGAAVPYLASTASFVFRDSNFVPESIDLGQPIELQDMVRHEALPSIATLRELASSGTAQGSGVWFAGSDQAFFGGSTSVDAAVDAAKNGSDAFRRDLEQHCITLLAVSKNQETSAVLNLSSTRSFGQGFQAHTYESAGPTKRVYNWDRQEGPLPGSMDWQFANPSEQAMADPHSCKPGPFKGTLAKGAAQHIQEVATLDWGKKEQLYLVVQFQSSGMRIQAPQLDVLYASLYGEDGAMGAVSAVVEAPILGTLIDFNGQMSELSSLQGSYGWPYE